MSAIQSSILGGFSGNNGSNNININIVNNYGIQVPSYVAGMRPFTANICIILTYG